MAVYFLLSKLYFVSFVSVPRGNVFLAAEAIRALGIVLLSHAFLLLAGKNPYGRLAFIHLLSVDFCGFVLAVVCRNWHNEGNVS